jgi:hypothetical protein
MDLQMQEVHNPSTWINLRMSIPRHIIIWQNKQRMLKAERESHSLHTAQLLLYYHQTS